MKINKLRLKNSIFRTKKSFEKIEQPLFALPFLRVFFPRAADGLGEFLVELAFRSIGPATVKNGVAFFRRFDDIEHLALELKFPGVFPFEGSFCVFF